MKTMTPLNYIPWIAWVGITILQIMLWKVSKGIFKFFRVTMLYLLIQSFCFLLFMIFRLDYKMVYYITTMIECLMLAGLSIEIGSSLVPHYKRLIQNASPVVIAIPVFVIAVVIKIKEIENYKFIISSIRIAEIAFILSLCVIFFCMSFDDIETPTKFVARSYVVFMLMLIFCTECQLRLGINNDFIRTIWPLSWLTGLSIMYVTLRRCRNKGGLQISYS